MGARIALEALIGWNRALALSADFGRHRPQCALPADYGTIAIALLDVYL